VNNVNKPTKKCYSVLQNLLFNPIHICNRHVFTKFNRNKIQINNINHKLGQSSQYSDWLRTGRSRGWSSTPGRGKTFLLSMLSRLALGPTQPPIQWTGGSFPGE
jgi:hypothetical protein